MHCFSIWQNKKPTKVSVSHVKKILFFAQNVNFIVFHRRPGQAGSQGIIPHFRLIHKFAPDTAILYNSGFVTSFYTRVLIVCLFDLGFRLERLCLAYRKEAYIVIFKFPLDTQIACTTVSVLDIFLLEDLFFPHSVWIYSETFKAISWFSNEWCINPFSNLIVKVHKGSIFSIKSWFS